MHLPIQSHISVMPEPHMYPNMQNNCYLHLFLNVLSNTYLSLPQQPPAYPSFSSVSLQDTPLPPVLQELVKQFSQFMQQQRETSNQFSHFTDKALKKIKQDAITQGQVGTWAPVMNSL